MAESVEYTCDDCGSEWTRAIPGGRCLDCGNLLTDTRTGLKMTGEEQDPMDLEEEFDDEDLFSGFDTDNPHLQKLFSMEEYGHAPGQALRLLREVSPDPEEEFLSAIKCRHGSTKWGYLILTTNYVRWIQAFPRKQDDFWTYDNPLQTHSGVIVTPEGLQFQTSGSHARRFTALYRVAQQAAIWEMGHPPEEDVVVPVSAPSTMPTTNGDLAGQLERLAQLLEKGLLTPDEFSQAKARLLS